MVSVWFKDPFLKIFNSTLLDLPSPMNLSTMWNFGSLLSVCLLTQILSGVFLALHYSGHTDLSFMVVILNHSDVNFNWILRIIHANGASMFFVCLYLHVARGIYYGSYHFIKTWVVGSVLLLLVMASAFLGYVLPWGQMSFWGATVITSLFSAIPYFGKMIVSWLWGGFSVDNPTLLRFFGFHFILPFIVLALVMVHIAYLHQTGSSNPLGLPSNSMKIYFHYYFVLKDLLGLFIFLSSFGIFIFFMPWVLGDPENFIEANPLVTPAHIQPEWYFLFAYAILRAIPNKLGGVMALAGSVLILLIIPFMYQSGFQTLNFYMFNKWLFWGFIGSFYALTKIGAAPVEEPYIWAGQYYSFFYFFFFCSF